MNSAPLSLRACLFRLALKYVMPRLFPANLSLAEQRAATEENIRRYFKKPKGVTIEPINAGPVPAEWVTPQNTSPQRVILYLHGGGYTTGSPRTHRDLTSRLAIASDARVLVLDYRLAPEQPYPAALDDVSDAYYWLLKQGIEPKQIVVAGDSAGGGLALALLLLLREHGDPFPAAAICISPWTDLTLTLPSVVANAHLDSIVSASTLGTHGKHYAGEYDLRLPFLSPLYADLHGLPPLLIHVGSHEILLDDAVRLAEHARSQGVDVTLCVAEGLWHVWHIYASFVPEAQTAIEAIGTYIRQRVG
jgi:epsilon-lactone hydrolase